MLLAIDQFSPRQNAPARPVSIGTHAYTQSAAHSRPFRVKIQRIILSRFLLARGKSV